MNVSHSLPSSLDFTLYFLSILGIHLCSFPEKILCTCHFLFLESSGSGFQHHCDIFITQILTQWCLFSESYHNHPIKCSLNPFSSINSFNHCSQWHSCIVLTFIPLWNSYPFIFLPVDYKLLETKDFFAFSTVVFLACRTLFPKWQLHNTY